MFTPKIFTTLKDYSFSIFKADLFAGVTVGIVALPLAMAFAISSGLPPERGIFTAIIAGFLISALGGSRVQIGGPTGAFVIIVSGIVAQFGYQGLVYSMLLASVFLILFGLFRMGTLIKFIPFPVTTGFTSGIAVVIFSTQIRDLFGLQIESIPADFIEKWAVYSHFISTINPTATALGFGTIAILLIGRKFFPRIPYMLLGMTLITAIAVIFQLDVETIGSRFGELPRTLPTPYFPPFDYAVFKELVAPAFTISLLAAIESLLSATVADGMTGGNHRSNIELIAVGIANLGSALFGGIPATGAIARTATNVKSGGKTPVAGMIHAITLGLLLLFLAPYAKLIPMASLAGILVVVSYNMSEIGQFKRILKAPRSDIMVLCATFLLTIFIDLTVAVEIGIVLAALLFIRRMSEISNVGIITKGLMDDAEEPVDLNAVSLRVVPEHVEVFEVKGPFFFAAADRFKEAMRLLDKNNKIVILRLRSVPVIDATGIHLLTEFYERCQRENYSLILSGVHAQPLFALQNDGLLDSIGEENVLSNIDDALNRARVILGLPTIERTTPFVPTVKREMKKREDKLEQ